MSTTAAQTFPLTYREAEMHTLARWIAAGQSGSVVGLPGCGRSNLLEFLCSRREVLFTYIGKHEPITLIPMNLLMLPANDAATFYRALLRAFYQAGEYCPATLREHLARLYWANLEKQDPFLSQSALYEILLQFQREGERAILVLNYFHQFVQEATPKTLSALRGLRDTFKHTLSFIIGTTQEVAYLPEPEALGELYDLLDRNVCWVGALSEADARNLIARASIDVAQPEEDEIRVLLALSGQFPALLHWLSRWRLTIGHALPSANWDTHLLEEGGVQRRLEKLWRGLTQEEQFTLAALNTQAIGLDEDQERLLLRLARKGVCHINGNVWEIRGTLLAEYTKCVGPNSRGLIWMEPTTLEIFQGKLPVRDLTPLEAELLRYFIAHPGRPQDKETLITHLWPGKEHKMNDNDVQQLVSRLRKKVDTEPPQYIITWKHRPGGYQFYPEGRPG